MSKTAANVVDASAILAYVQKEPGYQDVEALLLGGTCMISTVNVAEILSKLEDRGMAAAEAREVLIPLNLTVVDFDEGMAVIVAELRPLTREAGLSIGDRACLGLAKLQKAVAHTTDRVWGGLKLPGIAIHLVRPGGG